MKFKTEADINLLSNASTGLELRFALTWYATSDTMAKKYSKLSLRQSIKRETPGSLSSLDHADLMSYSQILVEDLVARLGQGNLLAHGRIAGGTTRHQIPADWWRGVTLDLGRNTAEAGGTVMHAILVFDMKATKDSALQKSSKRLDYSSLDRPLIQEMAKMIDEKTAKGPQDAARAIAFRAEGNGNEESKVKRLLKGWSKTKGQSGQP